jgi:molybdopterin synthase sulfur carrier subunit
MRVQLYATLRQIVGAKVVEVPVQAEQTVGDVLRALVQQYPDLNEAIWYADGSLAGHVAVILNGRDIRHLKEVDTPISGEDSLNVFPPIGGGSDQEQLTRVKLKFTSFFRKRVGKSLIEFSFRGNTLSAFIQAVVEQFDLADLLMEDGELRPYVRVVINGRFSYLLGGFDAHIPEGAMLVLLHSYVVAF